jgi:HEAT repeat protein/outer membrane protein assembly factor BamB
MADPKKIEDLIRQLGDDEFTIRESAFSTLATFGAAATPGLKKFEQDPDTERRKRVLELQQHIEVKAEPGVQSAAARLIARTRPAGAADVLLAYLPYAVDAYVINDLCKTLGAVAVVDGNVDPALVKALADSAPIKRAAAGEALIRASAKDQLAAARGLLKDADSLVRLRVALALVPRRDKEVVPVLIDLLGELNRDQLSSVEDVLVLLAGEKAPSVSLGTDPGTRKTARDAWQKWYTEHKETIDLAKIEQPDAMLGYTVIVQQTPNRIVGGKFRGVLYEVMEIKQSDKSVRWKFETNTQIVDAQVVGENRVLVAEYPTGKISERDFKGVVLWEKTIGGNPISVQRLINGNTFVAKNNGMVEFDRKGNEVYSFANRQFNVVRGKKLRNGEVVMVVNAGNTGVFTHMDAKNKVIKTFNINAVNSLFGSMDILPGGGILVPDMQRQRVVEYDKDGKELKSFNNVQWPLGSLRLPNGNTLVTCQNPGRVIELDRKGEPIWTHACDGNVFNARRR